MTNISELQTGQGNVNVEGTIKEMGEVRTFNKYGRELKVVNAVMQDDSGSVKLTLWNNDAMAFKEGDKVRVVNGYVGEFQGEKQLTSGKYGKLEKVENEEGSGEGSEENAESMEGSVDESSESGEESSDEDETSSSGDNSGNEKDNTEEKKQESESGQQPTEESKGVEDY